jgi:hypothetical protein
MIDTIRIGVQLLSRRSGASNEILPIFTERYAKGVGGLSAKGIFNKSRLKSDQGFAEDLAIYYWKELVSVQHPLLTQFLDLGDEEPARAFISHIGRRMTEVKNMVLVQFIAWNAARSTEW